MANQLTDSETKMLRERLSNVPLRYTSDCAYRDDNDVLELLSELLLAAKEKPISVLEKNRVVLCEGCRLEKKLLSPPGVPGIHLPEGWVCTADLAIEAIRNSWDDLFEGKS